MPNQVLKSSKVIVVCINCGKNISSSPRQAEYLIKYHMDKAHGKKNIKSLRNEKLIQGSIYNNAVRTTGMIKSHLDKS